jgi:uncharacterized protein (DUF2132 family)
MTDEINFKNNPLHGVSLKTLLTEMVGHYGFEILYAYMQVNCFKTNPSIESSVKFLKKTDWAREKVEAFYMYEYKNLPKPASSQFAIPPRDRIVPEQQKPAEPAQLSLEDAARLQEKRAKKAAEFKQGGFGKREYGANNHSARKPTAPRSNRSENTSGEKFNPWDHRKK